MAKKDCATCKDIEQKKNLIYEDEQIVALLSSTPSTAGHVLVMPKEHYPIIEQVPDFIVANIFNKVNKISIAVFESIGATGTNVMVQNGVAAGQKAAHFTAHIIPRRDNDGLNFQWEPKQISEDEMSTAQLKLKDATQGIGAFEQEKAKPVEMDKKTESIADDDTNYLIKQLRRIP